MRERFRSTDFRTKKGAWLLEKEFRTTFIHRRKALFTALLACAAATPLFAVPVRAEHAPAVVAARPAESFSVIRFFHDGTGESVETTARNVADFLVEQGIAAAAEDFVSLDPTTPLSDGLTLEYRSAVPVTLVVGGEPQELRTSAATVGALLTSQSVQLGALDKVSPALGTSVVPDSVVRVQRVRTWIEHVRDPIAPKSVHRLDLGLAPDAQRVLRNGTPGLRETTVRVVEIDGVPQRSIVLQRVLRKAQPQIVGTGIGAYNRLAALALRGVEKTVGMARAAFQMVATAYTAGCSGCSGYTAIGARAGRGIVAVDPRVIPLGTHLYIPGYGHAIAGDTGGAIHGNRIDLGFDSYADAMRFGRRVIQVYVLR
jgi:3D (Asp-Asp-Asp) domain-containing protein